MKKISLMLLLAFIINFIAPLSLVLAAGYDDVIENLSTRTACTINQYEVAMINSDGALKKIACYNSYNEAKTIMDSSSSSDISVASIIYYVSSTVKQIIDTKYGMLFLKTKPSSSYNTNLYGSETTSSTNGYINGYYGTDAPLIDYNHETRRSKLKISGYTGWVRKIDSDGREAYQVIPISLAKSPTYYYVSESGELMHRLTADIKSETGYSWSALNLGPAPEYMQQGKKYYSFDGNYFYTSLITMLTDYKNNTYVNATNATNAFYNYYQYLPYRTKTSYTSTDINEYIKSRGYTKKPLAYPAGVGESVLYAEGPNFIESQEKFGANALLTLALSINESGWGRSKIAINNKNIFGHGAYDYDPVGSADSYSDVKYSIFYHADVFVSFGYANPADGRYNGSHFGNKASGMNVKYASDPYWSEKMASHYYLFDKALGKYDYKQYQIGLKKTLKAVNVRKEPTTSSVELYQLKANVIDIPVVILGEVTGQAIEGNNKWYKIQSDPVLDANRNVVTKPDNSSTGPLYDWDNSYAYVHSSTIEIIGEESQFVKREGLFHFEKLDWNTTDQTMNFRGYLIVKGVNNSSDLPAEYSLILKDVNDKNKEYIIPLDRWTNFKEYPFQIPNQDGFDYSAAWFNAKISLKDIPQGDYVAYVRARINKSETTAILRNMFSKPISTKVTDNEKRGYLFRTNYYIKDVPLEIFIRDDGLISSSISPTRDNMINTYHTIDFNNNLLNIRGTSFNIGADYGANQTITRKFILENNETFERFVFNSNYIDNGDYQVTLRLSDGLNKTRAWFDSNIDVSLLTPGTYTIYIKTKAGNVEDYGELNDIFMRTLNKKVEFGEKTVYLQLNKDKRMRIELVVKQNDIVNDVTSMNWNDNGINIEGWAFSKNAYPYALKDIIQKLVLTNTVDNTKYEFALNSVETCDIINLNNCEIYNRFIGYKGSLDLIKLSNGKYLLSIDTAVAGTPVYSARLANNIDLENKIVRAKIGKDSKLLTFEYQTDKIYLIIEDFEYEYDIAIDVGHCKNCDTKGTANSTMSEIELNYIISAYEKRRYEEHGLKVWINRTSVDGTPEMIVNNGWSDTHRMAYTLGYKGATSRIIYSNHHNGSYPTGSGFEIILPASYNLNQLINEKAIYDSWATIDPANLKPSSLQKGFYTRDYYDPSPFLTKVNGEVYSDVRNYYAVIRMPLELFNIKSILYEPIYMTNSNDFAWYYTNQNWKKMSELKIKHYVESLGYPYDDLYNTLQ